MDSSGLSPQPSLPQLFMTGVDWSPLESDQESTGLDSLLGVHIDFYHCEILLEWSGVHWSPLEFSGVQWSALDRVGLLLVTYVIKEKNGSIKS